MQKPEVLVQGAKQGAPKNKPLGPKTRLEIHLASLELFHDTNTRFFFSLEHPYAN